MFHSFLKRIKHQRIIYVYINILSVGYVGGGHWEHFWSAAEPVCRPPDPDFTNSSGSPYHGCMCGAEFYSNFFAPDSPYQDLPCAVCSFPQATSVIMIPGKNTCYQGWNQEYNDFLSTNHYANPAAGKYVCIDSRPEYVPGGQRWGIHSKVFYEVVAKCGTLKCPPYIEGQPLTCVVCSK